MTSTADEPTLALEPEDENLGQRAFVLAYQALGRAARAMPEKTGRAVGTRLGRSFLSAVTQRASGRGRQPSAGAGTPRR